MHRLEFSRQILIVVWLLFVACGALANAAPVNPDHQTTAASQPTPALVVEHVRAPSLGLRDDAAMLLVGAALIGLAAAVRRAA
jgi:hypothetical protein